MDGISSDDKTVQVWDLATRAPIGNPFTGHNGYVHSVAVQNEGAWTRKIEQINLVSGSVGIAMACRFLSPSAIVPGWFQIAAPVVDGAVLSLAWPEYRSIIIGADRGIVVIGLIVLARR